MATELERIETKLPEALQQEPRRAGLLDSMADDYGLSRSVLAETLKKTIFPSGGRAASNEELAAFCAVAHHYGLNPFLKELYAFPAKGGGIVPIVSVDGWLKIVNRHPAMDGMEFAEHRDEKGKLFAVTCTIWRKDRTHHTQITEYLSECKRDTEQWRQREVRMLRHQAMKQCARVTFGFGGLYDPEEGPAVATGVTRTRPAIEAINAEVRTATTQALPTAPEQADEQEPYLDAEPDLFDREPPPPAAAPKGVHLDF